MIHLVNFHRVRYKEPFCDTSTSKGHTLLPSSRWKPACLECSFSLSLKTHILCFPAWRSSVWQRVTRACWLPDGNHSVDHQRQICKTDTNSYRPKPRKGTRNYELMHYCTKLQLGCTFCSHFLGVLSECGFCRWWCCCLSCHRFKIIFHLLRALWHHF